MEVIIGALIAAITGFITQLIHGRMEMRRHQMEVVSQENRRIRELEQKSKEREAEESKNLQGRMARIGVKCFLLLSELISLNSQTNSSIFLDTKSAEDLDAQWNGEVLPRIHRIELYMRMLKIALDVELRELSGNANIRWGFLRQHIKAKQHGRLDPQMAEYQRAIAAGEALAIVAKKLQNRLPISLSTAE